ncbi:MAG: tRNA (adenosine(37)-N6)-threonylcarbamoyltransferase complex dimerization subunit type 1 TsaB [bacterium]
MKILGIETCTEACSVALLSENGVQERYQLAPRKHTELVLPMTRELLEEARLKLSDLDVIAVSIGPGAFTGVRVGISFAQGLALPHKLPLVGINSLEAMAWNVLRKQPEKTVACCLDARMGEVYFASYARDGVQFCPLINPQLRAPEHIELPDQAIHTIVGHGIKTYPAIIEQVNPEQSDAEALPRASDVVRLARMYHADWEDHPVEPLYLRNNVAKKSQKQMI